MLTYKENKLRHSWSARMVTYWSRIVTSNSTKLVHIVYNLLLQYSYMYNFKSQWIEKIKSTLNNLGLSNVWQTQPFTNTLWLKNTVKLKLSDQYKQEWMEQMMNSEKAQLYYLFKHSLDLDYYLVSQLSTYYKTCITKYRTTNHRLPIEQEDG